MKKSLTDQISQQPWSQICKRDLPLQSISLIRRRVCNLQRYSLALLHRQVRKCSLRPDFEHDSRCAEADAVKCLFICDEFFLESFDQSSDYFYFYGESAPVWSWTCRPRRRKRWCRDELTTKPCHLSSDMTSLPFIPPAAPSTGCHLNNVLIFNFCLFSSCFPVFSYKSGTQPTPINLVIRKMEWKARIRTR